MSAHIPFKQLTIADVKRFVRDSKVSVYDHLTETRKELLKFLMNENEVGEGNQFLHNDNTLFVDVYDEINDEDSAYKTVLAMLLPTWWPEDNEDDDDESVHSTCCMDCDESFQFEEPVPAADYHEGRHEMRCPKCRDGAPEKYAGEDDEEEDENDKGLLRQKPAGEFAIGESAVFGMRYFGDDDRDQRPDVKILIKKGYKWAHWGLKNGTDLHIMKKTPLDQMLTYCPY